MALTSTRRVSGSRGADRTARGRDSRRTQLLQLLLLVYVTIVAYLLAQFSRRILPARNFNDDSTIRDFITGREVGTGPSPYSTTAWLFRVLGMGDSPPLVSFVAITLTLVAVVIALRRVPADARTWPVVGVAAVSLLLAGVYLGKYSKEFFIVPLVILFVFAIGRWWWELVWIAAACLYAAYVREYWFLVVALFVAFRLIFRVARSVKGFVGGWLLLMAGVVLIFNVVLGVSANYYRAITNDGLVSDRATVINDLLVSSFPPIQYLNLVFVALTLLVPLPLLTAGSLVHVASATVVAAIWIAVVAAVVRYQRARSSAADRSASAGRDGRDRAFEAAVSLLFAYLTTQSLFEPDYGSYLRHLAPLLPVAVAALALFRAQQKRHAS